MAIWTGFEDPKYDLVEKRDSTSPTLRDQFAMAALTGILASGAKGGTGKMDPCKQVAIAAYMTADAMLAAREAK